MPISIPVYYTDVKSLGDAELYARLRNTSHMFRDFVAGSWVASETADCRKFLTEGTNDGTEASYALASLPLPDSGGPFKIEIVRLSTGRMQAYTDTDSITVFDPPTRTEATLDKEEILDAISAITGGASGYQITFDFLDGATPIPDVNYTVTTEALVYYTSGQANANGQKIINLPNGNYRIYPARILVDFDSSYTSFTVNGAAKTVNVTGTVVVIPDPPTANTQTLYGTVSNISDVVKEGITVSVLPWKDQVVGGMEKTYVAGTTTTNSSGFWSMPVSKGADVTITIKKGSTVYYEKDITITTDATRDLKDYDAEL